MSYNFTELRAAETVYDLVIYANNSSGQLMMGLILFAVFFVFTLLFKRLGMAEALAGSSYVCFILSLYLSFALLVNFYITLAFLIIAAFATLYLYVKRTDNKV